VTPPRPTPLVVRPDAIPADVTPLPQWVNWRYEWRDDKWTKPPYVSTTGARASSTDPTSWSRFDAAAAELGHFDGLGLALDKDGDLVAVDLDHCRQAETGVIAPWAQAIVAELPSYWEISPSGEGLRCILRARLPDTGKKKGNIEVYDRGRYVTMTGHHLPGTPTSVEPAQAALDTLLARVFASTSAPTRSNGHHPPTPTVDDAALLQLAQTAANGAKFSALWRGDTTGYPSPSEADAALALILAFWTAGDPGRMDTLFRSSGLMRSKWDERHGAETYGQKTLAFALDRCTEHYTPPLARPEPAPTLGPAEAPSVIALSPVVYDAAEVDAWDFPPVQFLVDSLLPLVGVVWWGGLPKRTKSLLLLYLCLAVHCERALIAGHFPIMARPRILYVAREDGGSRLKERIRDICRPWNRRPTAGALRFLIRPAIDLMDQGVIDALAARCLAEDRRVLILDTWTALSPSADPVSAKDQARLAASVIRLAETIQGLVIVVDHSRKNRPDGQAMSSADIHGPYVKWAAAEHIVMLDTVAEKPVKRIEVFLEGKDVDSDRLFLTVSARGSGEEKFAYAGSAAALAEARQAVGDTNRGAVLDVVRKAPDALGVGEIIDRLAKAGTPLKKTATVNHLNALIRDGKVKTAGEGKDVRYFALDCTPGEPSRTQTGANE
jgi:DNA-binding transcriptional ArsR family regulator